MCRHISHWHHEGSSLLVKQLHVVLVRLLYIRLVKQLHVILVMLLYIGLAKQLCGPVFKHRTSKMYNGIKKITKSGFSESCRRRNKLNIDERICSLNDFMRLEMKSSNNTKLDPSDNGWRGGLRTCCRLLFSQWGSRLTWHGLIHNVLWHRWLASPRSRKCNLSCRPRFVGSFLNIYSFQSFAMHTLTISKQAAWLWIMICPEWHDRACQEYQLHPITHSGTFCRGAWQVPIAACCSLTVCHEDLLVPISR